MQNIEEISRQIGRVANLVIKISDAGRLSLFSRNVLTGSTFQQIGYQGP
jgi:hypothetical protein